MSGVVQNMIQQNSQSHHKLRVVVRWLKRITVTFIALAILLAASGWAYQSISEYNDLRQYSPPGKLVDIGSHHLHLYCTGAGTPTVVLESGLAGPALQWTLVQQELTKTTRVCSYDRAGLGWSNRGPTPRTGLQIVSELHALLTAAHIDGPYVLVGHSLGGLLVRLYADQYLDEVAGLVLVAAGHEDDNSRMPPEYRQIEERNKQTYRLLPILTGLGITRLAGSTGLLSAFTKLLDRFPTNLRSEMVALTFYRPQYWNTAAYEMSALDETKAQVATTGTLGDIPLVVLSGTPDVSRLPPNSFVQEIKETSRALQRELADLSSNSMHIVCDACDHYIPMTNPEKVVDAVRQMIAMVRL
jgi:pimeloyl-ACP methyl ester carboxylesterase